MNRLQELSAQALAREGDRPTIDFEGAVYGWPKVRHVALRTAELIDASGADPRAPIALIARNQPAAIAAFLGLLAGGRNIRMIYPFQSGTAIGRDITRLKPAVVVAAEREYADEVRAAMRELGAAAIVIREMDAEALPGFERSTTPPDPKPPAEPQIQILTSGTTGPPKQFAVSYELLSKHFVAPALYADPDPNEPPVLLFFPLGNISGLYSTLPPLLGGKDIHLLERFNLEGWLAYVKRYRPSVGGLPPAAVQMVLDADIPREDLAAMRFVGTGAAPLDPNVQRAFEDRYGVPILLSYGATEFGGPVTRMTPELHAEWGRKKLGTVGKAFGGAQIRVVDPQTGSELPPGREGVLEVMTPRIGPHWIRTSDLGLIDQDGFVFHRGRADGAIMRGGFKVLPETIERALLLHPAISAVSVVAVPDRRLGQTPGAAIQLKPEAARPTPAELEAHLREHVLATHIPVHWRFVDDLPRTPSMKVDRPAVARLFDEAPPA